MSVSLGCDCVTGMVLYNVMARRNDNAGNIIVVEIFWQLNLIYKAQGPADYLHPNPVPSFSKQNIFTLNDKYCRAKNAEIKALP